MIKQNLMLRLNKITQRTILILLILGGGAVAFAFGIILTHMIAS